MGLYLPQRWRRQPQYTPRVNYGSSIAAGIGRLYWFGSGPPVNLVSLAFASAQTAVVEATTHGLGRKSNGSTTETLFASDGNLAAGSFTFFLLCRINSIPANFACLFDKPTGGSREVALFYDTAGKIDFTGIGGGNLSVTSTLALTVGALSSVCLTRNISDSSLNYFVNGVKDAVLSTAASGTTTTGESLSFGKNPSGGGSPIGATYYYGAHWPRVLADAEVCELSANPWQLVAPMPARRYFFSAGAAADTLMGQASL